MSLCYQAPLLYNRAMSNSKYEHRRTLWVAALAVFFWAFLIYWQGEITWPGFSQALISLLAFEFAAIQAPYGSMFLDVMLFVVAGIFAALFWAHFVLPIKHPNEIKIVLNNMVFSLLGRPQEALILKNGSPGNSSKQDRGDKAAGIFLLDRASAAVLRSDKGYTRVIGPGLSFARKGEYFSGSMDLHAQRRTLGPLASEDPFAPKEQNEELVSFRERQGRRQETSAMTQDGVEIVPRIEVDFRLEGRSPKDGNPFPFQAEFVWRALTQDSSSPLGSSSEKTQTVSWDWLPVHLATDLWRDYLSKLSVHELFETEESADTSPSGLERLEEFISSRLTNSIVPEAFNANGTKARNVSSAEYQLLRSRGCRVLDVRIRELHLDPMRDETRLVNEWSEAWEMRAIQSSIKDGSRYEAKERSGQQAAAAEFMRVVSSPLYVRLMATDGKDVSPPNEAESVKLLLSGSLDGASKMPALSPEVNERLQRVVNLLNGSKDE